MKNLTNSIRKYVLLIITALVLSFNSYGQFYEWAYAPGFLLRGASGSFKSTDMHGNGYFIGIDRTCMVCNWPVINCYAPGGQVTWSFTMGGINPPFLFAVDADSSLNRYVLMQFQSLPTPLGNFSITDTFCLVKFNSAGNPIRVTPLPEKYNQVKTDSVGNAFVSNGTKVRRYNKFGIFSWEYIAGFNHKLILDGSKNSFLINDSVAVKLNPSGILKYNKVESGGKTVDIKGRLYVSTTGGLKKYDKNGFFQWIRPAISGGIQVNSNGNVYEFRNDSIIKYNQAGNVVQWVFEDYPSMGLVNTFGDIFFGGGYDPFTQDIKLCPFRLPSLGSFEQFSEAQVWVAKLNGKDPMPFQAAVYTSRVGNIGGPDINKLCSSDNVEGAGPGPLFQYCTNANSSFVPGNQFTVEISDNTGNFNNAINIGPPATGQIPDSLPFGTAYRVRVVSSTPGVNYYANLPYSYNSNVTIYPNIADLSLTGSQTLCQGFTIQLSVATTDSNSQINWFQSGNLIPLNNDITEITIDTTGYYYAVVANGLCFNQSDTIDVTLRPRPDPVIIPSGPTSFCQGDSVTLTVADSDLNSIRWRLNGTNIPGYYDTTFTVNAAGDYSARITNVFGCAKTSSPVTVAVTCREGELITNGSAVMIYPNPVANGQTLYIDGFTEGNQLEFFNSMGQLVLQKNHAEASDGIVINLPAGVYMVSVNNGRELTEKRVMVVE